METKDAASSTTEGGKASRVVPLALLLVGLGVGGGAATVVTGMAMRGEPAPEAEHGAGGGSAAHEPEEAYGSAKAYGAESAKGVESLYGPDAPPVAAGYASEPHGGGGEHANGGAASVSSYLISDLVLNPAQSQGTRFLMTTVSVRVGSEADVEALAARDAEVRDAVLQVLGSKTVPELVDPDSTRDALKAELHRAVDQVFRRRIVQRVYLPKFVVQ